MKAADTEKALSASTAALRCIEERRDLYRSVARRGALLFLTSQDLRTVNIMYQTSLTQIISLLDKSIDMAEKSHVLTRRVRNVTDTLTYTFYKYISRGLFECDRMCFKLILILKILSAANIIDPEGMNYFLGTHTSFNISTCFESSVDLDPNQESSHLPSSSKLSSSSSSSSSSDRIFVRANKSSVTNISGTVSDCSHVNLENPMPYTWMSAHTWANLCRLSSIKIPAFQSILSDITSNEQLFKEWYQTVNPESHPVPVIETKILKSVATASSKSVSVSVSVSVDSDEVIGSFNRYVNNFYNLNIFSLDRQTDRQTDTQTDRQTER